jgi:hypothetical protein
VASVGATIASNEAGICKSEAAAAAAAVVVVVVEVLLFFSRFLVVSDFFLGRFSLSVDLESGVAGAGSGSGVAMTA